MRQYLDLIQECIAFFNQLVIYLSKIKEFRLIITDTKFERGEQVIMQQDDFNDSYYEGKAKRWYFSI